MPGSSPQTPSQAPLWVASPEKAFPNDEWFCAVERADDRETAREAALNALARQFRVDVSGLERAVSTINLERNKGTETITKNSSVSRQFESFTEVAGLVGVTVDMWAAPDGRVYSCARINRKDSAALYARYIAENDALIAQYRDYARHTSGALEAYTDMRAAWNIAKITDDYRDILSLLNLPAGETITVAYGNAAMMKKEALSAARNVNVNIHVDTDIRERIANAFGSVFTAEGFTVNKKDAANAYRCDVHFTLSPAEFGDSTFVFARYAIEAALRNTEGAEIMIWSYHDREGHVNEKRAAERAVSKATSVVTDTANDNSFAASFNRAFGLNGE